MPYIDEEIAKIMKRERMKVQREIENVKEQELEENIEQDDIIAGIKEGQCQVLDRIFLFSHFLICGGRIEIDLPSQEIEVKVDQDNFFQSLNMDLGFACNGVLTDEKSEFKEMSHYKEMMKKNMKQLSFKWVEEGSLLISGVNLQYIDFINGTGLGAVHNSMWFFMTPYGQAQFNLNYDHADHKYFKHIIPAIMKTLKIN